MHTFTYLTPTGYAWQLSRTGGCGCSKKVMLLSSFCCCCCGGGGGGVFYYVSFIKKERRRRKKRRKRSVKIRSSSNKVEFVDN